VVTSAGTVFDAGAVIIAGGVGSFQPRRLHVPEAESFEGRQLHYKVGSAVDFIGRKLVIFGGGDSALDWTVELAPKAASLTLVHRRAEFRGAPASVARMRALEAAGKLRFIEGVAQALRTDSGRLLGVEVKAADGGVQALEAEQLLVFFGLAPKLGRLPNGASNSTSARSGSTPKNSRAAYPAYSRSVTSTPIRARRS